MILLLHPKAKHDDLASPVWTPLWWWQLIVDLELYEPGGDLNAVKKHGRLVSFF